MTFLTAIFILLVGGAAAIAVAQSLRAGCSRAQKTVFVLIRILIAALLILACIEPVLTVHRIPSRDRPLVVLVDASSSMSLFATDTTIIGFLNRLKVMGDKRGRNVTMLLFGDSLREKKPDATYAATDRKSFFPSINDHAALRGAAGVLIVSDGNWSNSGPVAEGFTDKPVNFPTLSQMRRPAWIACNAPDTVMSTAGARCSVSVECSGFATTAGVVAIEAAADDKPVFSDTIHVEAGRFSRPLMLRLPSRAAGMHLFRITLTNPRDTVSHRQYLLCRNVPLSFTYTIAANRPSLDERFLRLALAAVPAFRETATRGDSREQVRFILHAPAADMPPSPTLPVYIGCLPTATTARKDTVAGTGLFLPPDAISNPLDGLSLQDAPPMAFVKPGRALTVVESWLATRAAGRDTIPLLFHAMLRGRPLIACAFEGLWKWDFLPLSHRQGEADAQLFSRRLLAITQSTLMAAAADTMIAWPVGQPSAFSTLKLACSTPRHETSIGTRHSVACSITGKISPFRYDTMLAMAPGSLLNYHTLPPLQPGDYSLRCSLSTSTRNYQSSIPFTVDASNGELLANGQNTALLRELGQPVDISDTARIAALFNQPDGAPTSQPVEERFPIKRSWWILGALFALFGAEWLLRRVAYLD